MATKINATAAKNNTAKAFAFTGANASVRTTALAGVASLAYAEGNSRGDVVKQVKLALGAKPTADALQAVRVQYVIGRVAQRLSLTTKGTTVAELIALSTKIVTLYKAPVQDGKTARKLKAGEGRRTVDQHKMVRAADEAWSQIKAEAVPALSNAKTQQQKNAAKKRGTPAAAMKAGTGITHSELVKADGPMTGAAAREYLNGMAATMLAFCNKHAGVVPTDYGTAVRAFKAAADKASIAFADTQ